MQEELTLIIDNREKNATSHLLPNLPLVASLDSGWNNVHLAYFHQPAWELPKFCSHQHVITIPILQQIANVEFVTEENRQRITLSKDDYVNACVEVYPANLSYKISWDKEVEFLHFYLEPEFVSHVAHESIDPDRVELLFEPKKSDPLIHQICQALKADLDRDGTGNGFYADSMATALAAHLIQHYSTRKHTFLKHENGLSRSTLDRAVEYINEHLNKKLLLAELSAELNMSQYYFCRLFKLSTGMTPHQYLIQQRVEYAKRLLKQSDLAITPVALECGFANQSHFAKYFRLHTGVSPKEFRKYN
ncbi:helix-turn-helix transcriptional regulator [Cyanobacteria bacterium FACHB-471]|nr:helix-turn-helix transcriptional regulator [Cyanobacteria bacterium FACHB-471]